MIECNYNSNNNNVNNVSYSCVRNEEQKQLEAHQYYGNRINSLEVLLLCDEVTVILQAFITFS